MDIMGQVIAREVRAVMPAVPKDACGLCVENGIRYSRGCVVMERRILHGDHMGLPPGNKREAHGCNRHFRR